VIITIGGIKGGTGKTTIATNFAVIAANRGAGLLLVDADEQESASAFAAVRREDHPTFRQFSTVKLTGQSVRHEVQELHRRYVHIIIDTGGRDTTSQRAALSVSDVLLVPFAPRCFDVWTVAGVGEIIDAMRSVNPSLRAYACLNRADPASVENQDACRIIQIGGNMALLPSTIVNRKAYAHAASAGKSVTELTGKLRDEKASREIMALYAPCFLTGEEDGDSRKADG